MTRLIFLCITIALVLVGCSQDVTNGSVQKIDSTKQRVYSSSWDGNPLIVKQRNTNEKYDTVNEITASVEVEKLIEVLGNADWQENVKVDIEPPDYRFSWNSFNHSVWINEEYERLELLIEGQSNYGTLSADSSEIIFEILTGETLEEYK